MLLRVFFLVVVFTAPARADLMALLDYCMGRMDARVPPGPPVFGRDPAGNVRTLMAYLPELAPFVPAEGHRTWRDRYFAARGVQDRRFVGGERGTRAMTLADGTPVVMQRLAFVAESPEEVRQTVRQMIAWHAEGRGVRIVGAGVEWLPGLEPGTTSSGFLYLVTEDYHAPRNALGAMVAGSRVDRPFPALVRELPVESRRWLREEILRQLDTHGDPNLGNVLYRVTRLAPGA